MIARRSVLRLLAAAGFAPALPARSRAEEPPAAADAGEERLRRLRAINDWGYWLASFDVARVAAAPHDLMVIDSEISDGKRFEREFSPEEVARMRMRPDGRARILLAYLSIGEAERYRPYWKEEWDDAAKKPPWLDRENSRWKGNFAVQFWEPDWQRLIFGGPGSHLDRIVAQGFDGVYLDRADAFFEWRRRHPSAAADMASFIARLAQHARAQRPEFLVVMQNAEELLDDPTVLDAIDGIAKEDLLYGVRHAEEPNRPEDVTWSIDLLRKAQAAGRRVLVVEYLKEAEKIAAAATRIREEGFVPYFAPRLLNCLNPPAVPDAAGRLPPTRCK
jgi:cysteinyl-tRNA synthetase, unknown class